MQFSQIIGQEEAKRNLVQTVQENRVSHAQMFLGPPGSGKLALAVAYAQYINCSGRNETDSCGICPSCQKFAKLAHPDLHFSYPVILNREKKKEVSKDYITEWREYILGKHFYANLEEWYAAMETEKKQGVIGAAECDDILRTLSFKSYEGKYKVMIIWMAERLYQPIASKLLKILEEPPDKTLFILVVEKPEEVISTILSRTQIVKIPRLDDRSLASILTLQFGYDTELVDKVLPSAGGNVNLALKNLEESMSGVFSAGEFREWMLLCFKGQYKDLYNFVSKIARNTRPRQKQMLEYGLSLSRNCLLSVYGRDDLITILDEEEASFVKKISKFLNEKNALAYAGLFEEAMQHIDRNGNASVVFMDVSLKAGRLLNPGLAGSKR